MDSTLTPQSDLLALLDAKVLDAVDSAMVKTLATGGTDADAVEAGIVAMSKALCLAEGVEAPHVPGMARPFLPHQEVALRYALDALLRWPGVLIGDDMGLGKTQVMLALIAHFLAKAPGYAVVIAPPVTFGGWASDMNAAFPGLTIAQLKGRSAPKVCTTCGHGWDTPTTDVPCTTAPSHTAHVVLPHADVLFVSDDPLTMRAWFTHGLDSKKRFVLSNTILDAAVIVRDEIHRDKGADGRPSSPTSRAKLMLAIGDAMRGQAPIIAATGSLTVNRPIEALIPMTVLGNLDLLKALAPGIRNAIGFAFRYCAPVNGGYGYSYAGTDHARLPELHERLRATVMLRRNKQDIGNLPHFEWRVLPYALNGKLARLRRLEDEFLDLIREEEGVESMWRKARAEAITKMQAMWQEAGVAKGQATVDYLLDVEGVNLTAGKPVILFYWHGSALDALTKALGPVRLLDPALGVDAKGKGRTRPLRVGTINGKVTGTRRQTTIDEFQAGKVDVLCAQLKSAGIGVTLTAAADAVFVQCPFSAGDLAQAAGRILRTDQISRDRAAAGEGVRYHVLLATHESGEPTFDHAQFSMVENKATITDVINSGEEVTMPTDSVMLGALRQWFDSRERTRIG